MAADPARPTRTAQLHDDGKHRCAWCENDPLMVAYHDEEWGRPLRDERRLFEMLCLEGAQAGLSWRTVLHKRPAYRLAFDQFDATKIASYTTAKKEKLLTNAGIVRNRLKVNAFIGNAQAYLKLLESGITLNDYLWQFTNHKILRNRRLTLGDYPASTEVSDAMAKDMRKRGFRFVGTTICYALMQSVGIVDDHQKGCWVGAELDSA